ncbi:unnamed protein product [Staurois parvus]|uniref:Uncharacterized protein n=1 Tax=Staurois parvus TaxID=386267 RepID=A0ABN9EA15_9NEOB|nr:unnamed protein product [Staurois parvus]
MNVIALTNGGIDTGISFFSTSNDNDQRLIVVLRDCIGLYDTGRELTWCH